MSNLILVPWALLKIHLGAEGDLEEEEASLGGWLGDTNHLLCFVAGNRIYIYLKEAEVI